MRYLILSATLSLLSLQEVGRTQSGFNSSAGQECRYNPKAPVPVKAACVDTHRGQPILSVLACLPPERCRTSNGVKNANYGFHDAHQPNPDMQCPPNENDPVVKKSVWVKIKADPPFGRPDEYSIKCNRNQESFDLKFEKNPITGNSDRFKPANFMDLVKKEQNDREQKAQKSPGSGGMLDGIGDGIHRPGSK